MPGVSGGGGPLGVPPGGKLVDAGLEELTFAPGVGLVRIVEQTIAGPRTKLLGAHRVRATL